MNLRYTSSFFRPWFLLALAQLLLSFSSASGVYHHPNNNNNNIHNNARGYSWKTSPIISTRRSSSTDCHGSSSRKNYMSVANVRSVSSSNKLNRKSTKTSAALTPKSKDPEEMTLEELRASLPIWAKFIANGVEVTFVTGTSYLSGGFLGYFIGGIMGLPLLVNTPKVPGRPLTGLRAMNSKAVASGKNWGSLNASFSGFHSLARVARNGKEDRWNAIFSSFCTGAYLNREQGPQAMIRNGATFASFTYFIETFFSAGGKRAQNIDDRDFDYREVEVVS